MLIRWNSRTPSMGCSAMRRASRWLAAIVLLAGAAVASAQVAALYFQEVEKEGRIYVFNTPERYRTWLAGGELGPSITLVGRGRNGETVVGENETAIDLFLFRHNLPGYERPTPKPTPAPVVFPQVKLGTTMFLSYQNGKASGADFNKFTVKRGYLDFNAKLTPYLSARVTPDVTQDASGELRFRLKYAYAYLTTGTLSFVTRPFAAFGMIQTPYIDFEEKIAPYRMQDTLFLERVGIMSSADQGVMVGGLLGPELDDAYQKTVSGANPGRWGSFAIGVYNGGGYTASEVNGNKVVEGRLSIRPLPGIVPGLQITYFGVNGKGNAAVSPVWTTSLAAVTFESRYLNAVASYLEGRGNSAGTAIDAAWGEALDRKGWSVFAEGKLNRSWSVIGRLDRFTPDTRFTSVTTRRIIGGVCYHLAKGYDVLLDQDEIAYNGSAKQTDTRTQLTLQIKL